MANPLFSDVAATKRDSNSSRKPPSPGTGQGGGSSMDVKSPNWPGVPGKTQPKDRSAGVPRVKSSMKKVGI